MTKAVELAQVASNGVSEAFKNRIINGAMVIDQRNAGASVTPTDGQYLVDRWCAIMTTASKYTAQQNAGSVTPPAGFSNYLGLTSSSAYSVGTNDLFGIHQRIEGFNTADLNWGTANAQTVTLSFWVRSSLTGTFGGSIINGAQNYSYPFSYSIPVANTWTQISITIAGPTSGTWVGATNGIGMQVNFGIGGGSTYSGTAGSWASQQKYTATGATSVVGTNGATFYITGVQLEVGSSATSFETRQYTTELQLCQRYFYVFRGVNSGTSGPFCNTANWVGGVVFGNIIYPTTMRTSATLTASSASALTVFSNGTPYASTSIVIGGETTTLSTEIQIGTAGGFASGDASFARVNQNTSTFVSFSAEL